MTTSISALVVAGVSGSGKTTVGQTLAKSLGWGFIEGDALHPEVNRGKMAAGVALNDDDRQEWLSAIKTSVQDALEEKVGVVVACSALKISYRKLFTEDPRVGTAILVLPIETALSRVAQRKEHFFPASLVKTQYDALELLSDDQTFDATLPIETIVTEIRERFGLAG